MAKSLLMSVAYRLARLKRAVLYREARYFNERWAPQLPVAYAAFARRGQISTKRQPLKGRDLWRVLSRANPKHIVELGSGTTSAVFSLWSRQHGSMYTAFEHHEGWAKVTVDSLGEANLAAMPPAVTVVPTRVVEGESAIGFAQPLPLEADFIYVDGPPCVLPSGRKVPNDDIVRHLASGGRPDTIVVDGRIETVDLILRAPEAREYSFQPSLEYAAREGMLLAALRASDHTVFRRHGH